MKWHRINALIIRHLYLYKRSVPRLMDVFFWPIVELLLWGFISIYLESLDIGGVNIVTVLLGAIILWDILSQSQRAVSIAFLEDIWERNLLNIFVTPLRMIEVLVSTILVGFVRIIMVAVVMAALAFALYKFNLLILGLMLIPFFVNLLLFGWGLGLFATALILRYGSSAQVLAFGLIFIIQPFSAIFYPVSALPEGVQFISYMIPVTYVFEGMREVIATQTIPINDLLWAFGTNVIYLILILWFFYAMFARVKEKGLLLKLD